MAFGMTRKPVRVGGAVLAALTIGGAGTTIGVATAGAEAVVFGSSTGSVDGGTPWRLDEFLSDHLRGCRHESFYVDSGPCYDNGFSTSGTLGDYKGTYDGPDEVEPGAEVEFIASVRADMAAYDVTNPDTDVDVTSVAYQPPEGFEFMGVVVRGRLAGDPRNPVELPSTVSVNPDSGRITVSAPAGGWAMNPFMLPLSQWTSTNVTLQFTFRAPEGETPGRTSGFTFTGTSVPTSSGLVAAGTTRVWPEAAEGTGGSGS
ncbi:hypothetical protein G419_24264 [Rhodococcus triatomae BKS 15-14]|nr:hypothetical protein G419_24264 [Rhodococcus triatomae BKS 15-14]